MTVLTRKVSQAAAAEAAADFQRAFVGWRASRPAWTSLTTAIRTDRPAEELRVLAAAAGTTPAELLEMAQLHTRALRAQVEAGELRAREKDLAALDAELTTARTKFETAGAGEAQRLAAQIESVTTRRRTAFGECAAARQAAGCCRAAEQLGVL